MLPATLLLTGLLGPLTPGLLLVRTALLLTPALLRLTLLPLTRLTLTRLRAPPALLRRLPLRRLTVGRLALRRAPLLRRLSLVRGLALVRGLTPSTALGRRLLAPTTLLWRLPALSPVLPAWLAPRLPRTPWSLRRRRHICSF